MIEKQLRKIFKKIILNFKKYITTLHPVLCNPLIKKGRGIWPDEALAT